MVPRVLTLNKKFNSFYHYNVTVLFNLNNKGSLWLLKDFLRYKHVHNREVQYIACIV